jgi:tetratricopeptide (TPR) repeat protein
MTSPPKTTRGPLRDEADATSAATQPQPALPGNGSEHASDPLADLASSLDLDPLNIALHSAIANVMQDAGDETGSRAHRIALETFDAIAAAAQPRPALALFNLATYYYLKGDNASALRWYKHTLEVEPDLAMAHQNLAAVFDLLDRPDDAQVHRNRAYSLQRVFIEPSERASRRVLILCAGRESGNIPIETLLPRATSHLIKYAIDWASEAEDSRLPPFDLVFNTVGDPDVAQPLTPRLEGFARRCARPLLNRPAAVMRTQRHRLPELLAALDDVLVPPCVRLEGEYASPDALAIHLVGLGIGFPLLMRPLAKHGGDGLTLHDSVDTLWPALDKHRAPCYLTMFRNFCSADGYFRKYRIVFVDREPYAYHLAISSQWMVHYVSAEMTTIPWKLDEERRFLLNTNEALGERAAKAIAAIGRRLDLDYAGIDFTLLEDGRVLVFEANATMLIHHESPDGVLAHKNPFVQRIADAFEQLQVSRTRVSR